MEKNMEKNKEGLYPCPFCGNRDIWLSKCSSSVQCRRCFCKSPMISKYLKNGLTESEAAVEAWNTRADHG